MTATLDPVCEEHLEALHFAIDYIPKRALRFFLEGVKERTAFLIQEMEQILQTPEVYREEGSRLLYYGVMILASLHQEEGIAFISKIGRLSSELIEEFLGDRFFDSFTLAIAELHKYDLPALKAVIEDREIEPALRAAALQAMMILFGQKILSRNDVISYFKKLLENRKDKIPYFFDVIAGASFALHPEEIMESLRAAYSEGFIDPKQIQLQEIEEVLALPKDQVVLSSREMLSADLTDLIDHLELATQGVERPDRNEPCPCGSGNKFKKCCI